MASYWRALALAGVLSLMVGCHEYEKFMRPPLALTPIGPILLATFAALAAAVFVLCCTTTIQAVWYLIRRQKGTAGGLLITAGAPPALILVLYIIGSFVYLLIDPAHLLGVFRNSVSESIPYLPFPVAWIATGIWLVRLDRRQRLAATALAPEIRSIESGKWPPLPFGKKQ